MTATPETTPPDASPLDLEAPAPRGTLSQDRQSLTERVLLFLFIAIPLLAVVAAIPIAWGWGVGWLDLALLASSTSSRPPASPSASTATSPTASFKAKPAAADRAGRRRRRTPSRARSIRWVADHRKHHAFSDRRATRTPRGGSATSTWRADQGPLYAHMGWLFDVEQTSQAQVRPRPARGPRHRRASRACSRGSSRARCCLPAVLGGLLTWSWWGALTAFFWAGLVRVALVHHVTWSINSICHVWATSPFKSRDRSGNVWWLAIPSLGESWHNLHHADPTCARHGVEHGQIDISARLIAWFEQRRLGHGRALAQAGAPRRPPEPHDADHTAAQGRAGMMAR